MVQLEYFLYVRAAVIWENRNLPAVSFQVRQSPNIAYMPSSTLALL